MAHDVIVMTKLSFLGLGHHDGIALSDVRETPYQFLSVAGMRSANESIMTCAGHGYTLGDMPL